MEFRRYFMCINYEIAVVQDEQERSKIVHEERSGRLVEIATEETVRKFEEMVGADRRTTIGSITTVMDSIPVTSQLLK